MTDQLSHRIPLSAAQQGVWFAHRLDPTGQQMNCAEYLDIVGPVDAGLMRHAWRQVAGEADAVRTAAIVEDDGDLLQIIASEPLSELECHDLSGAADPAAEARRWATADLTRAVQPAAGGLVSAALLTLADDRHWFYYRLHHAVIDGYGVLLLGRRLAEVYTALAAGPERQAEASGPPLGSIELLVGQDRAYRDSAAFARDRDYWAGRLGDQPEVMRMPGRPAAPERPLRLSSPDRLGDGDVAALSEVARSNRTTWQVVLLTAIAGYVHRVTDRRDVILGLPVAGRRTAAARLVPGMATNSVALRIDVDPARSLTELIPAMAAEVGGALRHERYRAEDLRRALGLTGSANPFLGPMVNFMPYEQELRFGAASATFHNLASGPIVDYSISISGTPGGPMPLMFEANPEHHDEQGLRAHKDRALAFIRAVLATPDTAVGRLEVLTPDERAAVLAASQAPERSDPSDRVTVEKLVERQASATPDAVALVHGDEEVTYTDLAARAAAVARCLAARAVGPEDFVALAIPRSPGLIVAMLGVLRSGAAYAPIDVAYPEGRIRFMLEDLRPRYVLVTEETAGSVPDGAEPILLSEAEVFAGDAAPAGAEADHPAYVIYTSGSTGTPKGVVVSRRAMLNFVLDHADRFGFDAGSRSLQFASPSFDVATGDIWPVLVRGGRLVLPQPDEAAGAEPLVGLLRRQRITHAAIPPVMLAQLRGDALPELVSLITGGETPGDDLVRRWAAGRRMANVYGVTEAAVASTVSPPLDTVETPAPIGHPIRGTQALVLDSQLTLTAPGVAGELFLGGAGLARGYLGRPMLTAERFVPNPYGPAGSRLYRTGDVVRRRADDMLEFSGRTDNQVKIRGFRVELGEVEAALAAHPAVAAAVVVLREDQPGHRMLVGYARSADGAQVTGAQLRRFAGDRLPEHMVPAAVVLLDELPVTPHGKVDRKALAAPVFQAGGGHRPDPTSVEGVLCELFAEALGQREVGVDDSFFELGGDSIRVFPLVANAAERGLEFSARDVFQHATVARLAQAVRRIAPEPEAPAGQAEPDLPWLDGTRRAALAEEYPGMTAVLPVSPLQEGLLFQHLVARGGRDAYTSQVRFHLTGRVDPDRLRSAADALLERHENLRAVFRYDDGFAGPVQVITGVRRAGWAHTDLSEAADAEAEADRLAAADRERGFDLTRPPLLRLHLIRLGDRHLLTLTAHHVLWDGWSTAILVRELFTAYAGGTLGPVTPYRNYLRHLTGTDGEASRRAWREALDGLTAATLVAPGAQPAAGPQTQLRRDLDESLSAALTDRAQGLGVTLNTIVEAAWATVLSQLTGRDDVVFGASVSGRPPRLPGVENIVGLLTNTVPVRVRLRAGEPAGALLQRVQNEQADLIAHHHLGLGEIQRQSPLGGELFDTAITFVNYSFDPAAWDAALDEPRLTGVEVVDDTHYPVRLVVVPGERIHLRLGHRPGLFRPRAAEQLLDRLVRALRDAA
ncbi:amino acid adenylation domain-containing protein [Micromonospora sp. DT227]|uniref:amino acid adenylation domain-containing protein n=1 Tax=Micromonospora sp. DT227 TaxID=3393433 RepID=UPI003CF89E17